MIAHPIKVRRAGHPYDFAKLIVSIEAYDIMMKAGITQNLAIRTLNMMVNGYSGEVNRGATILVSKAASHLRKKDCILEHGSPRTEYTRLFINAWRAGTLTVAHAEELARKYWVLAYISREEDNRLNKLARSKLFETPRQRWAHSGIMFEGGESV